MSMTRMPINLPIRRLHPVDLVATYRLLYLPADLGLIKASAPIPDSFLCLSARAYLVQCLTRNIFLCQMLFFNKINRFSIEN